MIEFSYAEMNSIEIEKISTDNKPNLPRIREEIEFKIRKKSRNQKNKIKKEEMYGPSDAVFKQRKADSKTES
jgi:hypothetical protein